VVIDCLTEGSEGWATVLYSLQVRCGRYLSGNFRCISNAGFRKHPLQSALRIDDRLKGSINFRDSLPSDLRKGFMICEESGFELLHDDHELHWEELASGNNSRLHSGNKLL
jgi:hypothetical protein